MVGSTGRSAASLVFAALIAVGVLIAALIAGLILFEGQRAARAEAERVTHAVAQSLADTRDVSESLAGDPSAATATLQPLAEQIMADAGVDFVTIMTPAGIRVTHRDPAQIGRPYLGTIPESARVLTEEFSGTLGPSIRTIVPVGRSGAVVGWVSVGLTLGSVTASVGPRILVAVVIGAGLVAVGFGGALLARRATRRVAGDLPAGQIRDTLAAAESMRTLGEALRGQTHEHANRMHTALALIELGRTREAIDLLSESSAQSQRLVDQVSARHEGDPTVGALLLGKASQAAERGVTLTTDIAPDAPRSVLSPTDQVALVGNLIDNAMDAASAGAEPRWVRVTMARTPTDELSLVVADSGDGIAPGIRGRIFERGFSTKPADATGRGVGLALVDAVVSEVGGTIAVTGSPTTFHVVLPTERSAG